MAEINLKVDSSFDEKKIKQLINNIEEAQGIVLYPTDYALFVEVDTSYDGTMPPHEPIREWVVRNITQGAITASEEEYNSIDSITWAVRKKIAEQGIKGVYFLTEAKINAYRDFDNIAREQQGKDILDIPESLTRSILKSILEDSNAVLREEGKIDTGELIDSGLTVYGVKEE